MFKIIALLCFACVAYGMDCSFMSKNQLEGLVFQSCPNLLSSSDEKWCCPDSTSRCCDFPDFISQWFIVFWPYILLVLVVCFMLSCICCCLRKVC